MSEKPLTIIVLVLLLVAITFYLRSESPQTFSVKSTGAAQDDFGPAPDLTLPIGPNGKKIDLSSLHGHVVIVDFWATWCGPCKMSIPDIESIYERHKADGLEVYGISVDDNSARAEVASTVKTMGMKYPTVMAVDIPDVRTKYEFASIPLLLVIDKKGIIRSRVNGYDPNGNNEDIVAKLLKEK